MKEPAFSTDYMVRQPCSATTPVCCNDKYSFTVTLVHHRRHTDDTVNINTEHDAERLCGASGTGNRNTSDIVVVDRGRVYHNSSVAVVRDRLGEPMTGQCQRRV